MASDSSPSSFLHATAGISDGGTRLDKFLSTVHPELSRARVQTLLAQACVTLNGATVTDASKKVKPGEEYRIAIPPVIPATPQAQALTLDIVYEDAHLLVLNKAAGMTVHPAPGNPDKTLVNALLAHCGESLSGIGGVARPGIVHRIDKDTTGLLVVAKHDAAHAGLSAQLAARTLKRKYIALVWGCPRAREGIVDAPIARSPKNRKRMAVVAGGKHAVTRYTVQEVFGQKIFGGSGREDAAASQLLFELETGRTHQIRVHATHIGHSLIGDPVYGGDAKGRLAKAERHLIAEDIETLRRFKRQALHAFELTLEHPITHEILMFSAPLPADMLGLIDVMRSLRG